MNTSIATEPASLTLETLPQLLEQLGSSQGLMVLVIHPDTMEYRLMPKGKDYVYPTPFMQDLPGEVKAQPEGMRVLNGKLISGGDWAKSPRTELTLAQVGEMITEFMLEDSWTELLPPPFNVVCRNNYFGYVNIHPSLDYNFLWCGADNKSYTRDTFADAILFDEELSAVLGSPDTAEGNQEVISDL